MSPSLSPPRVCSPPPPHPIFILQTFCPCLEQLRCCFPLDLRAHVEFLSQLPFYPLIFEVVVDYSRIDKLVNLLNSNSAKPTFPGYFSSAMIETKTASILWVDVHCGNELLQRRRLGRRLACSMEGYDPPRHLSHVDIGGRAGRGHKSDPREAPKARLFFI